MAPSRRKGVTGLSPLSWCWGPVELRLVASHFPRVLIDAVDGLGEWDAGAFRAGRLVELHYGTMAPSVYRTAAQLLRKAGLAFWPPDLRRG